METKSKLLQPTSAIQDPVNIAKLASICTTAMRQEGCYCPDRVPVLHNNKCLREAECKACDDKVSVLEKTFNWKSSRKCRANRFTCFSFSYTGTPSRGQMDARQVHNLHMQKRYDNLLHENAMSCKTDLWLRLCGCHCSTFTSHRKRRLLRKTRLRAGKVGKPNRHMSPINCAKVQHWPNE